MWMKTRVDKFKLLKFAEQLKVFAEFLFSFLFAGRSQSSWHVSMPVKCLLTYRSEFNLHENLIAGYILKLEIDLIFRWQRSFYFTDLLSMIIIFYLITDLFINFIKNYVKNY